MKMEDYEEAKRCCEEGMSTYEMAKRFCTSQTNIRYWIKKMGLKIDETKRQKVRRSSKRTRKSIEVDWSEIQKFYDSGKPLRDIPKIYRIQFQDLKEAASLGLFKPRTKEHQRAINSEKQLGRKIKQEFRQKMSKIRRDYLSRNKLPVWKTHNKFKSVPCEWLKERLSEGGYVFEEEHQPLRGQGRFYSIDIAFPDKRIGIEINGAQHYKNGELTEYYQKRHDLIEQSGWKLIEIKYHSVMGVGFLEKIENILKELGISPVFMY